jgi:hypothetical protein
MPMSVRPVEAAPVSEPEPAVAEQRHPVPVPETTPAAEQRHPQPVSPWAPPAIAEAPPAPEAPRRSRHAAPDDEPAIEAAAAASASAAEAAPAYPAAPAADATMERAAAQRIWAPAITQDWTPEAHHRPATESEQPAEPQAEPSNEPPAEPRHEPAPESAISVDDLLAAYGLASTSRRRRRD